MMLQSNAVNLTWKKCKRRDSNGQRGRQLCFEEGVLQHPEGDDRATPGMQRLLWDFLVIHLNQRSES